MPGGSAHACRRQHPTFVPIPSDHWPRRQHYACAFDGDVSSPERPPASAVVRSFAAQLVRTRPYTGRRSPPGAVHGWRSVMLSVGGDRRVGMVSHPGTSPWPGACQVGTVGQERQGNPTFPCGPLPRRTMAPPLLLERMDRMTSMQTRRSRPNRPLPARRRDQPGMALAVVLFTLGLFLTMVVSSMAVAMSNIRATRNYRGASQVHFAAESGVMEALQLVNGPGVVSLQNDVINQWSTLWGGLPHTFTGLSGFTVNVTPVLVGGDTGRLV